MEMMADNHTQRSGLNEADPGWMRESSEKGYVSAIVCALEDVFGIDSNGMNETRQRLVKVLMMIGMNENCQTLVMLMIMLEQKYW